MLRLSTKIIISISFVLFLIRLFLSQSIYPEIIHSNDFYGYIELGKNIFSELDFVVRWQLDNPTRYPPFFSILIQLLTFFTKDPLVSIQYLNAFSVSFCLIPLFLVTRKLLNTVSAFVVTVFMTYFFGLYKPCYTLSLDYFFTFLAITIFWLIWEILTGENRKAIGFVSMGFLISLAYLTRYQGIIYCLLTIILMFFFYRLKRSSLKTIFKKILFLILGFLPLFIIYNALVYNAGRHEQVYDIGTYTFFDGNYYFEGEREHKMYMLNPEGTEFNHLSNCQTYTVASFCLKYPNFIQRKYFKGLKRTFKIMTKCVFPFKFAKKGNFHISIQYILLILILGAVINFKYRFKIMYVFLFASTILFLPLYLPLERYLMPYIPFYLILWLVGVDWFYNLFDRNIKNFLKYTVWFLLITLTVLLVYNYTPKFYKEFFRYVRKNGCPYKEYLKTASWIKNDSKNRIERPKIMSRKTTFAYLANAYFICIPYENDWEKIIHFALMKNVNYIILDKKTLSYLRPDQYNYLTKTAPQNPHINLEYKDEDRRNVILLFKMCR